MYMRVQVPAETKDIRSPEAGGCEPDVYCELNSGFLQEWYVLLTAVASLWLLGLNSWSSCLHFLSPGIIGLLHPAWNAVLGLEPMTSFVPGKLSFPFSPAADL